MRAPGRSPRPTTTRRRRSGSPRCASAIRAERAAGEGLERAESGAMRTWAETNRFHQPRARSTRRHAVLRVQAVAHQHRVTAILRRVSRDQLDGRRPVAEGDQSLSDPGGSRRHPADPAPPTGSPSTAVRLWSPARAGMGLGQPDGCSESARPPRPRGDGTVRMATRRNCAPPRGNSRERVRKENRRPGVGPRSPGDGTVNEKS